MIKFIYATQEEVPEALRSHYTEVNGKWVLSCEGAVPTSRLDEFRDTNIKLKQDLEAFKGIDPTEAKELIAKAEEIRASKAKTDEEVQKLIDERVAKMNEEHATAINELTGKLQTTEGQLSAKIIDSGLIEAGSQFGLRSTAHEDAIARGRSVFKLEDGKPVAINPETGEKQYGADGQPLDPKGYMEQLAKSAPHLFDPSAGAGAKGGKPGTGAQGGPNPWKTESFNMTKQGELFRSDPTLARQLAAQAGVKI